MSGMLRVIDAGLVPAVRSQSLWHGIASAMRAGDPPVLSFCIPADPYVCIGFHRRLTELDLEACSELDLPVYRRQIGGGPVYCDSDQLFFQLTLPAASAPSAIDRLYEQLLSPAAAAFRRLGLDARLADVNEIVVGDRKLSGTGAGRIGEAVTVVGNVIFRFPHAVMARVMALPDEGMRTEFLRLMRRYVSSLHDEGLPAISSSDARDALVASYAQALGRIPEHDQPSRREERAIAGWERRLGNRRWLLGPAQLPAAPRSVKVRAGVLLAI